MNSIIQKSIVNKNIESEAKNIWITKASGERAIFSKKKLRNSLEKSGANEKNIQTVISEIEKLLHPGMHTKEIYKKAFALLRKTSRPTAARYKLKRAIMQLGPSGFPFEQYIAEVFRCDGYRVSVGEFVKGHCITHEVDIIAKKKNQRFVIECKFHSDSNRICDVKIPLYINSRFLDMKKERNKTNGHDSPPYQGWIVTNTRFSKDAMQYGTCAGLYLLGWNYPRSGSLKERIDLAGVHPITCMTTMTGKEKQRLLKKMVVLAKDLCHDRKILLDIGISELRAKRIMEEARGLCGV